MLDTRYWMHHQYPKPIVEFGFAQRLETETTVIGRKEATAIEAVKIQRHTLLIHDPANSRPNGKAAVSLVAVPV